MRAPYLALLLCLPVTATAAATAKATERLDPIVVSATGNPESPLNQPLTVHAISGEDWENLGARPETALAGIPGLAFSAAGGPGQPRSLFLRGAKGEHVLVLVDGLPVNDPLAPSRSFDFGQLPLEGVERVEVLAGPQSVLYGGDAIGGVVQFFTPRTPPRPQARIEAGSYGTLRARAAAEGFRVGFERSEGYSAADEADGNKEADGHRAFSAGFHRAFALGEKTTLRAQALFNDARTDTDMHGGPGGDSLNTQARNRQAGGRLEGWRQGAGGSEWSFAASAFSRVRHDNTIAPAFYRAQNFRAEARGLLPIGAHLMQLGIDGSREQGRSSENPDRKSFDAAAAYLEQQWRGARWHALAGARADRHRVHPGAVTWRAGAGYWLVPEAWRVRGSLGSGYKAPSLYQTYSIYGSSALSPERSLGGELGIEWRNAGGATASLTGFATRFRSLIDFDPALSRYFNYGRVQTRGLELGTDLPWRHWLFSGALTYLRAENAVTHEALARRPRWSGQLAAGYELASAKLGGELRYVGDRADTDPISYARKRMPAFFTLGLHAKARLSRKWAMGIRAENLLNRKYQETAGYGTPGRSGYVSVETEL